VSLIKHTVEDRPSGPTYSFAMHILDVVIPEILDLRKPFTTRSAKAFAYLLYLQNADMGLCHEYCEDLNYDYHSWGTRELEIIAKALAVHASNLLRKVIHY